jgi:hypothetical protein
LLFAGLALVVIAALLAIVVLMVASGVIPRFTISLGRWGQIGIGGDPTVDGGSASARLRTLVAKRLLTFAFSVGLTGLVLIVFSAFIEFDTAQAAKANEERIADLLAGESRADSTSTSTTATSPPARATAKSTAKATTPPQATPIPKSGPSLPVAPGSAITAVAGLPKAAATLTPGGPAAATPPPPAPLATTVLTQALNTARTGDTAGALDLYTGALRIGGLSPALVQATQLQIGLLQLSLLNSEGTSQSRCASAVASLTAAAASSVDTKAQSTASRALSEANDVCS